MYNMYHMKEMYEIYDPGICPPTHGMDTVVLNDH
jgi:hypothetical protein